VMLPPLLICIILFCEIAFPICQRTFNWRSAIADLQLMLMFRLWIFRP